jgi:hypothetical protein
MRLILGQINGDTIRINNAGGIQENAMRIIKNLFLSTSEANKEYPSKGMQRDVQRKRTSFLARLTEGTNV